MLHNQFPNCEHIKRSILEDQVTPEVAEAIGRDFRALPILEKGLYEYNSRKHYSLQTNEYLKCRWAEYKANYTDRVFAPVQVLNVGDYHFYNYSNRLAPSESVTKRHDHRRKLRPGPGVDSLGQIPVPDELIMKRGSVKKPKEHAVRDNKKKHNMDLKTKHH